MPQLKSDSGLIRILSDAVVVKFISYYIIQLTGSRYIKSTMAAKSKIKEIGQMA